MMICSASLRAVIENRLAQVHEAGAHEAANTLEAVLLDITRAESRITRAGSIGLAAVRDDLVAALREIEARPSPRRIA